MGTIGKAPAASIRGRQHDRQADNSPGPGKYLVEGDLGKNARNAPSIRSRHALTFQDDSPGPGAYKYYSPIGHGEGPSIKSRHPVKNDNASPGPKYYAPEKDHGPAYSFTTKAYADIADKVFRGEIPID